jgi:hypothetical protein
MTVRDFKDRYVGSLLKIDSNMVELKVQGKALQDHQTFGEIGLVINGKIIASLKRN